MPRIKWGARKWGTFKWGNNSYATIGGVKYDETYGLHKEDILTTEADILEFGIITTYANKPVGGQEVLIYWDADKIFGGRVQSVEPTKLNSNAYFFQLTCIDYTVDLDKKLVVEDYGSDTLYNIIKDIMDNYTSGLTYTNVVNDGRTLDGIKFNYIYPSQCLAQLADIFGWDWYIDKEKDLHFFPEETANAPYEINDANENFDELKIIPDTTQLANDIIIRGGKYLSITYTQDTITASAGQTEFPVRYRPYELAVTVGGASKTVAIEFLEDAGTHDFILNADEKLLKVDTITMSGGEAVVMTYKYKIPLLERVKDPASILAVAAIEGGDGIYEKIVIDENITERDVARDRGKAELSRFANPIVSGSFITTQSGYRSGQRLHIQLTDRNNLDEYYLIKKVTTDAIGGNNLLYTVEFATFLLGFNWLLMKILDATQKHEVREDEVLDVLVTVTGEQCTMTDAAPVLTKQVPPFQYGPGGSPQGVYGRSEYS